jgi:hypothetical protein
MLGKRSASGVFAAGTVLALALTGCGLRAGRPAGAAPPVARDEPSRAELERRLHNTELLLAKAQTAIELGDLQYRDQIEIAEKAFELAKRHQQSFAKFIAPHRLARAELNLQQAEDRVREARLELEQLEPPSSTTQPAGPAPDNAAAERARRRLDYLQRDLELCREEFKTLKDVTLPLEQMELDLASEEKKRAVLQTQRDNEGPIIDRQVALSNAEAEVARLEKELGIQPQAAPSTQESAASQPSK